MSDDIKLQIDMYMGVTGYASTKQWFEVATGLYIRPYFGDGEMKLVMVTLDIKKFAVYSNSEIHALL